MLTQEMAIKRAIRILKEGLAAPIAPLCHMMRVTGKCSASQAGHAEELAPAGGRGN